MRQRWSQLRHNLDNVFFQRVVHLINSCSLMFFLWLIFKSAEIFKVELSVGNSIFCNQSKITFFFKVSQHKLNFILDTLKCVPYSELQYPVWEPVYPFWALGSFFVCECLFMSTFQKLCTIRANELVKKLKAKQVLQKICSPPGSKFCN